MLHNKLGILIFATLEIVLPSISVATHEYAVEMLSKYVFCSESNPITAGRVFKISQNEDHLEDIHEAAGVHQPTRIYFSYPLNEMQTKTKKRVP